MRKLLLLALLNILTLFLTSCSGFAVIRYDGPYKGRVIDADTGKPIEGVVVLGVWNTVIITPGGATGNFYDAQETLSDKSGEFSIPGLGLKVLSNVAPMDVLIFKAGYEHIGMGSWESLKKATFLKEKIKWEGNKAIIPLKKWTLEERRNRFGSYYVNIPNEKKKLLLKEIEKEYREIGR